MRLATWNIGSALGQDIYKNVEYIVQNIEKNLVDVLCLQEVVTSGDATNFIDELQRRLSFKYSRFYELSSAHLEDSTMMGIAVLSRYSIEESFEIKLTNPNIVFNKNGKEIRSDDKGFLVTEILYKGKKVKIVTGHMLPFHSLGSDSKNYGYLYEEMYSKVKIFCNGFPFILCGDFNSSKFESLVKEISVDMLNVFHEATRYNGNQNDYIFISKEWLCKSYRVDMNEYDHFLCVCEVELKSETDLNVLHLSDIHYLSRDYSIDEKSRLAKVKESDIRKRFFSEKMLDFIEPLDYVVVSGDITTGGNREGFKQFENFVREMQDRKVFPPSNHFVIVPGNHDVGKNNRWDDFAGVLGGSFVRPWIEDIDINPHDLLRKFSDLFENDIEDIFGFINDRVTLEKVHFPFLLDISNRIFIYAFNSSSISRTNIILDDEDEDFIKRLKSTKMSRDVNQLLNILEKELQIDPARVDPQELFLFDEFVKRIEMKVDLSTFHKIAVLHHHTTTISCTEEVKKFDTIVNAGTFKKMLSDNGFQIVMHGHKHNPDIFYDTAIENHKKLLVISGGTVFGYPNRKGNGFYIHTVKEDALYSKYIYLDENKRVDNVVTKLSGDMDIKYGLTLENIYKNVEYRVVQHINTEIIEGKEYIGWSKNIEERKVGVISTVYGLLILETLGSNAKYYVQKKEELIRSLWQFRHESGGWGAVSQITNTGAPEATAWVVLALFSVKSSLYKDALKDLYEILERMKDSINSNFTLGLIINILCKVDPDSKYIPDYCERLLDSAVKKDGKVKFWCSKCKENLIRKIEPSIVHTACAIIALYNSQEKGIISRDLQNELSDTREILLNKKFWGNTHEAISVQIGNKEDSLIVHYYTIAWILKALLQMDNFIDISLTQEAVDLLLKDYKNGYWDYEGNFYIWTIYDALTALEAYLLKK